MCHAPEGKWGLPSIREKKTQAVNTVVLIVPMCQKEESNEQLFKRSSNFHMHEYCTAIIQDVLIARLEKKGGKAELQKVGKSREAKGRRRKEVKKKQDGGEGGEH